MKGASIKDELKAKKFKSQERGLDGSKSIRAEVPGLSNESPDIFLVTFRLPPRDQNRE